MLNKQRLLIERLCQEKVQDQITISSLSQRVQVCAIRSAFLDSRCMQYTEYWPSFPICEVDFT